MFEKGAIPLINRSTKVTTSSATPIDNIFTNCIFDTFLKKEIIKPSFSDHFAMFAAIKFSNEKSKNRKIKNKMRFFSDKNKKNFKQDLQKINWEEFNILNCTNTLYKYFMKIYSHIYDKNFPLLESETKLKDLRTPWMSKAMRKSSEQKQRLYTKSLKSKNPKDELIYNYIIFEKLRKQSKQACSFIKNKTVEQVLSCEFCEISKNTFFTEHLWTAASEYNIWLLQKVRYN